MRLVSVHFIMEIRHSFWVMMLLTSPTYSQGTWTEFFDVTVVDKWTYLSDFHFDPGVHGTIKYNITPINIPTIKVILFRDECGLVLGHSQSTSSTEVDNELSLFEMEINEGIAKREPLHKSGQRRDTSYSLPNGYSDYPVNIQNEIWEGWDLKGYQYECDYWDPCGRLGIGLTRCEDDNVPVTVRIEMQYDGWQDCP